MEQFEKWLPLLILVSYCSATVNILDVKYNFNEKYIKLYFNLFNDSAGNILYTSSLTMLTDNVFSMSDNFIGEIAYGSSNIYDKIISVANDKCKNKENAVGSFAMKMLYKNLMDFVSLNTSSCPYKKGIIQVKNFPFDVSLIPGFIPSCKFHISVKGSATFVNNKRKVQIFLVDVFGSYQKNFNK